MYFSKPANLCLPRVCYDHCTMCGQTTKEMIHIQKLCYCPQGRSKELRCELGSPPFAPLRLLGVAVSGSIFLFRFAQRKPHALQSVFGPSGPWNVTTGAQW